MTATHERKRLNPLCAGPSGGKTASLPAPSPELTVLNLDRSHRSIDPSVFVAESATVIGDVTIGASSSVWFGCVVRGDTAAVVIGERTNLQDGAIVHVDKDSPVTIGSGVVVGHGAVIHGATVGDNVLVGIRAVILNGAVIGENSIVGACALVTPGTVIPPGSLVMGIPGRVVRQVDDAGLANTRRLAADYVAYAGEHLAANLLRERGPD